MSMVFEGVALTAEQVEAVSTDPGTIEELIFGDDESDDPDGETVVDLDKAWHGIHFLLTGTVEDASSVLGRAIMGGRPVGPDNGYGPARLLEANEVRVIAAALAAVDLKQLSVGYDALEFERQGIYPNGIWEEDDVLDDYLLPNLRRLTKFYSAAAMTGSAVVLALT
jgi:hypothetical protein